MNGVPVEISRRRTGNIDGDACSHRQRALTAAPKLVGLALRIGQLRERVHSSAVRDSVTQHEQPISMKMRCPTRKVCPLTYGSRIAKSKYHASEY